MNRIIKDILAKAYANLEPEEYENRHEEFMSKSDEEMAAFQAEFYGDCLDVARLRRGGCKVRVSHHRHVKGSGIKPCSELRKIGFGGPDFQARGGKTEVSIIFPDGETLEGKSRCSRSENFDRKAGLYYAIVDALS